MLSRISKDDQIYILVTSFNKIMSRGPMSHIRQKYVYVPFLTPLSYHKFGRGYVWKESVNGISKRC